MTDDAALLANLEAYYDTVPRAACRAEDFGSLTLFVREGQGYHYYARPTLGHPRPVRVNDVEAVRDRQRELGVPEAFEWVAQTTPSLRAAATAAGLRVHEHPLMVLDHTSADLDAPVPDGLAVRLLGPDDPCLASAVAVPSLAFAEGGTRIGAAGRRELEECTALVVLDGSAERIADRLRAGLTALAAVLDGTAALSAGQHNPVGTTTEIVGVGTLPAARRRGLGRAVTAALVADARARGVETVFLSAGDDDVARMYARIGFRRVGTALIAEPPA